MRMSVNTLSSKSRLQWSSSGIHGLAANASDRSWGASIPEPEQLTLDRSELVARMKRWEARGTVRGKAHADEYRRQLDILDITHALGIGPAPEPRLAASVSSRSSKHDGGCGGTGAPNVIREIDPRAKSDTHEASVHDK